MDQISHYNTVIIYEVHIVSVENGEKFASNLFNRSSSVKNKYRPTYKTNTKKLIV